MAKPVARNLFFNLRLYVWKGDTKLAGGTARRLAKGDMVSVDGYLRFVGRILLEDKYPEGKTYFRSLQHTLTAKVRDTKENIFVQYAVAASRLKSSQLAFQYAFVAMRKGTCGKAIIDEAVDEAVVAKTAKDKIEIAQRGNEKDLALGHLTFSDDFVLKTTWGVLLDQPLVLPATAVPEVRLGCYKPVEDSALAYAAKRKRPNASVLYQNETLGFMEQMELYIHDHGEAHYGDIVPLLVTLRREERIQRSLPVAHGNLPVTLLKKCRGGWEVSMGDKTWAMSHPKILTPHSLEKLRQFYYDNTDYGVYDVRRAALEAIKFKNQVYFMQEIVQGDPLSGPRLLQKPYAALPVLKILVYRHARQLVTQKKDILLTADGAVSVNETRRKHLVRHPNVWKKMFNLPSRASGVIEALRPAVLSQAFKDHMVKLGQADLHGRLVESISSAEAL